MRVGDRRRKRAAIYRVTATAGDLPSGYRAPELLALDGALADLEKLDPRQARIVELRFFAGLTVEETAEVTGVSPATVKREWRTAWAWLRREIGPS